MPTGASPTEPVGIAVFGSSEPREGSLLYEQARRVGSLLARGGYLVITGGYGGVMEAASRGAREAAGEALGITSRALRPMRAAPNPYLTRHVEAEGLLERTDELIRRSSGYIILPGKAGTLAELTTLWALDRARLLGDRPIVLLGPPWRRYLDHLASLELLERVQIDITHVAGTPEEAVQMIRSRER